MARIATKQGSTQVQVVIEGWKEIDTQLGRLPIEIRGVELERGMRKALNKIKARAVQLVSPPDYPGDKKDLKPLRDTIGVVFRRYKGGAVIGGIVGPEYPAGAHGHLVEHGHRIAKPGTGTLQPLPSSKRKTAPNSKIPGMSGKGASAGRVRPYPFMIPAATEVAPHIEGMIIASLQKAQKKATGRG